MAGSTQKPLELILARNFISSLRTPAFLVNEPGDIVFFNEATAGLLGQRFEQTGTVSAAEWTAQFGPFDADENPIPVDNQPLTRALRSGRPGHQHHRMRTGLGECREVEVSAVPIVGTDGFRGAIVFFWVTDGDQR